MSNTSLLPTRATYGSQALVIDIGTYTLKLGYTNDVELPLHEQNEEEEELEGIVMKEIPPFVLANEPSKVGQEALLRNKHRIDHSIINPIQNSMIVDWERMEQIWQHTFFSTFAVGTEEVPVVVCEPILTPRESREKLADMFFSKFKFRAYYVASEASFQLRHFNLSSGVVVDFGHSQIKISVIYRGYTLPHCCHTSPVGSNLLNDLLFKSLAAHGVPSNLEIKQKISKIKEEHCFLADIEVAESLQKTNARDEKGFPAVEVEVGNSHKVKLSRELCQVPEAIFAPNLCGYGRECSLSELIKQSKMDYEEFRVQQERARNVNYETLEARNLFKTFITVGGGSRLRNFDFRVKQEVERVMMEYEKNNYLSKVTSVADLGLRFFNDRDEEKRGKEAFLGACRYVPTLHNDRWVSDVHYKSEGASIVSRACPT